MQKHQREVQCKAAVANRYRSHRRHEPCHTGSHVEKLQGDSPHHVSLCSWVHFRLQGAVPSLRVNLVLGQGRALLGNANFPCPLENLQQRNVPIPLSHGIGVHATVIYPADLSVLSVQRGTDDLDLNRSPAISRASRSFAMQMIIQ